MSFKKYSSIENGYRKKYLQYVMMHPRFLEMEWQVTEKLHGTNLSFSVEAEEPSIIKAAKRSGLIEEGEKFYGYQEVLERYKSDILHLAKDLFLGNKTGLDEIKSVQIYGELFGPGVQKGVDYGEDKDFAVFDIRVEYEDFSMYLDAELVRDMCCDYTLTHVPVIKEFCKFDTAMNLEVEKVISMLGGRYEHNQIEGYVIKPIFPMFLDNGSRVIIKNKSKKFAEKSKSKQAKPQVEMSEDMSNVLNSMLEYLNENRLRNVLSKIGEVTQKDFGKIQGMLQKDLLEDWEKDNDYGEISKSDQKAVTKELNKETKSFIRERFLNIIDNTF